MGQPAKQCNVCEGPIRVRDARTQAARSAHARQVGSVADASDETGGAVEHEIS